MMVEFLIPNRDDASKPPMLRESWGVQAVPREGETVVLGDHAAAAATIAERLSRSVGRHSGRPTS